MIIPIFVENSTDLTRLLLLLFSNCSSSNSLDNKISAFTNRASEIFLGLILLTLSRVAFEVLYYFRIEICSYEGVVYSLSVLQFCCAISFFALELVTFVLGNVFAMIEGVPKLGIGQIFQFVLL